MQVRRSTSLTAGLAAAVGLALVVAAMVVPPVWERDVRVHWPPLHADWDPRLKPELALLIIVGLALWAVLPWVAAKASWAATVLL
ncbi:MAG: hypothetical protein WAL70_02255, partial [Aeromicrobium sp.]